MATEHARVLKALDADFMVIGRGEANAKALEEKVDAPVLAGGLEQVLDNTDFVPRKVIVAVNSCYTSGVAIRLIKYGVKQIFLEKPGFAEVSELDVLNAVAKQYDAKVYIAYNRRFYASVLAAEKIIDEDGGLQSVHFEFTEWTKSVMTKERPKVTLDNWLYSNSTHVLDLAFFLAGFPSQMSSYTGGSISWHTPAIFTGAGVTEKGVLFSYCANWDAPGRWGVELLTSKHRLYLKPMESLQIQALNSVKVEPYEIDDHLDKEFKPGFYLETKAFLEGDTARLCTLEQQWHHVNEVYKKIDGRK
jgi:predicted dehydrogenase